MGFIRTTWIILMRFRFGGFFAQSCLEKIGIWSTTTWWKWDSSSLRGHRGREPRILCFLLASQVDRQQLPHQSTQKYRVYFSRSLFHKKKMAGEPGCGRNLKRWETTHLVFPLLTKLSTPASAAKKGTSSQWGHLRWRSWDLGNGKEGWPGSRLLSCCLAGTPHQPYENPNQIQWIDNCWIQIK